MDDVAAAQIRDGLGDGGRLGLPQVAPAGDEALGAVEGVLDVDVGQGVPACAVELKRVLGDWPMLGATPGDGDSRDIWL